jgi:hypothetical protein
MRSAVFALIVAFRTFSCIRFIKCIGALFEKTSEPELLDTRKNPSTGFYY